MLLFSLFCILLDLEWNDSLLYKSSEFRHGAQMGDFTFNLWWGFSFSVAAVSKHTNYFERFAWRANRCKHKHALSRYHRSVWNIIKVCVICFVLFWSWTSKLFSRTTVCRITQRVGRPRFTYCILVVHVRKTWPILHKLPFVSKDYKSKTDYLRQLKHVNPLWWVFR